MKFALDSFSARDLDSLIKAAERQKQLVLTRRPKGVVRDELTALAAKLGYTIEELFAIPADAAQPPNGKTARKRRAAKAAIKYRDPDNKRSTWSGRGSQPRWLRDKVRRGLSPSDFLVPGLAKPTANTKAVGQRTVFKKTD